jgi:hypothetical protein
MTAVALLSTLALGLPVAAQTAAPTTPCATDMNRRKLDFWVGDWDVESVVGQPAGHSVVEPFSGGCGLLENWTDLRGGTGKSINAYNPTLRHWEQLWVGQFGAVTEYRDSAWHGDTLEYDAEFDDASGRHVRARLFLAPRGDGTVSQMQRQSYDDGKTWTTAYSLVYKRRR